MSEAEQEKKIVIDDDWKERAAAEKEAAEQQRKDKEESEQKAQQIPPASFSLLVSSYVTNAMIALGQFPAPNEEKPTLNLPIAKHHIDMLDVIEQKTTGNLEAEEAKMLGQVLQELRLAYVAVLKKSKEQPS